MTSKRGPDLEGGGTDQVPPPSVDDRLLRATTDVVATVGYAAAEAEDIVQASGLSRTVFYRHFGGKRRATVVAARRVLGDLERAVGVALAAHDAAARRGAPRRPSSRGTVGAPGPAGPRYPVLPSDSARAAAGLTALADALTADPPATAVLLLEAPAAGPDAQPLRAELLRLIDATLGDPPGLSAWSPAGAVLAVFHDRVARGDTANLPALVPELVRSLTPLVGTSSLSP